MKKTTKIRALAATAMMSLTALAPAPASAGIPTIDAAQLAESILTVTRWTKEAQHYIDQINKYREQIQKAQDLYDQLNNLKFADLISGDATGILARAQLQQIYDGTNENFGLGLPDLPTEGQIRFYEDRGFAPPSVVWPENSTERKVAEEDLKGVATVSAHQAHLVTYLENKRNYYTDNFPDKFEDAEDMKGNLELNNKLLYDNAEMMMEMIALQNARASVDVQAELRQQRKKQNLALMFGAQFPDSE